MIWYKYVNYKVLPDELTKKMIDAWDSSPNNNEEQKQLVKFVLIC